MANLKKNQNVMNEQVKKFINSNPLYDLDNITLQPKNYIKNYIKLYKSPKS